jgi:hypothetical protein
VVVLFIKNIGKAIQRTQSGQELFKIRCLLNDALLNMLNVMSLGSNSTFCIC